MAQDAALRDMAAGRLRDIRRYPVGAMGGELLQSVDLERSGVAGDRRFGVYARESGEVAAPGRHKHWRPLPNVLARLSGEGFEISIDHARWIGQAQAADELGAYLGFAVEFRAYAGNAAAVPLYQLSPIHLLTTASMRHLSAIIPEAIIDAWRFRPNLVIETADVGGPVEQSWLGRRIAIGDAVLEASEPCVRCAFTSIAQEPRLPFDKTVSGAIAQRLDGNFGILCTVVQPGRVQTADAVRVEERVSTSSP